ncbi:MAG: hypothetical protein RQ952_01925 [Thermoproteota archaeon]|jgi:hypothetical protein|nr:hypothetical protein [Thermoproteota archaeon]
MEATLLKSKEETIRREKKKAILLLSKGYIPKDYPKEKLLEYFILKLNYELNKNVDENKLKELENEIINWPRNPNNDPSYFNLINLREELYFVLGFNVEFAFEEYCAPRVKDAIFNLLSKGYSSIIIVPIDYIVGINERTLKEIEEIKNSKEIEIQIAWPYKLGLQADFIATHLLSFLRKPR